MESIHEKGLAKYVGSFRFKLSNHTYSSYRNIGVSNFNVDDLKVLLKDAKVTPAVNQVYSFYVTPTRVSSAYSSFLAP